MVMMGKVRDMVGIDVLFMVGTGELKGPGC